MTCECALCNGLVYVDEVALFVIEDALTSFVETVREGFARDQSALADAIAISDAEVAKVMAGG